MIFVWFSLIAAAVGVVGVVLARASDRLGEALRLERSLTGFLMLAVATSLPELVVSCQVAYQGSVDMAVGSLLGSCLMNLLILAAIDLSRRSKIRMLSRQAAAHALASLSSVLLAGIVAVAILLPLRPAGLWRIGTGSLVLVLAYLMTFRMVFLDRRVATAAEFIESAPPAVNVPRMRPLILYVSSTIGIFLLAPPLASTSERMSVALGLTGTFFGAVFLALVTSLPEVVTTAEASRMDAHDLAIGNILGSNAFNLLILVAVDIVHPRPLYAELMPVHALAALGVIITTTIALMGILYRVEKRLWYLEPDAIAVIGSSLMFFYFLYAI
ncbi:sodium:calcium antiporter [Roseiconus nitratireducens]|nr:hypothetical protein [Roseiconus nitratireducens]